MSEQIFRQFLRNGREIRVVYKTAIKHNSGGLFGDVSSELAYGELNAIFDGFLQLVDQRDMSIRLVKISEIISVAERPKRIWKED